MIGNSPSVEIGPFVVGEKPMILRYTFEDSNGNPLDLTGYTGKFSYRENSCGVGTAVIRNAVVISPQTDGKVEYTWQGDEFPTPGHYIAELWVGNNAQRFASILIKFDVRIPVGVVPVI